jgi:hypothetical protein
LEQILHLPLPLPLGVPHLPTPKLRQTFYGKSTTYDIIRKMLFAREVTCLNNKDASDTAGLQFDAREAHHKFLPQQLVLLNEQFPSQKSKNGT